MQQAIQHKLSKHFEVLDIPNSKSRFLQTVSLESSCPTLMEKLQALANAYQFPDHVRKIFQRGKHASSSAVYVKEFKFHLGHGTMFHGVVATMRNQNTMDMAYSFYQLDFQLTAERIEHVQKKRKKFLGIIPAGTKKKVIVEYRARYLSEDAFQAYEAYFRSKAANEYRSKFIGHDEL